jgi:hypothetical protein
MQLLTETNPVDPPQLMRFNPFAHRTESVSTAHRLTSSCLCAGGMASLWSPCRVQQRNARVAGGHSTQTTPRTANRSNVLFPETRSLKSLQIITRNRFPIERALQELAHRLRTGHESRSTKTDHPRAASHQILDLPVGMEPICFANLSLATGHAPRSFCAVPAAISGRTWETCR